jgi:hypothetical protein
LIVSRVSIEKQYHFSEKDTSHAHLVIPHDKN